MSMERFSQKPLMHVEEAKPRTITPSIHPDLIPDRGETATSVELRGRQALAEARGALEHLANFEAAARNDRTLTPDALELSLYDAKGKTSDRVLNILGPAGTMAVGAVRHAEKALHDAAKPSTRAHDGEIRAHVKSLPEAERAVFLQKRASAGDVQAVAALLEAPRYLSGLPDAITDDDARALRELAAASHAPHLAEQLERAREVEKRVVAAHTVALGMIPKTDARLETLKARASKRASLSIR